MKILALDQAKSITGYAFFENTDLVKWGVCDYEKEDYEARTILMCHHIRYLIAKFKPDIVVFEGVVLQKDKVQRLIYLAQLQGCIIEMCLERFIPYKIYQPSYWRSVLGFEQRNEMQRIEYKKKAQDFVRDKYGINVGFDCADAICIALAYLKDSGELPD